MDWWWQIREELRRVRYRMFARHRSNRQTLDSVPRLLLERRELCKRRYDLISRLAYAPAEKAVVVSHHRLCFENSYFLRAVLVARCLCQLGDVWL